MPVIFTTGQARRRGFTESQIAYRVKAGRWHRLRRGVYCTAATWQAGSPERRTAFRGMAAALLRLHGRPFALSHTTAAAMYGLPVPVAGPTWITIAAGHGASTHYDGTLREEVASLPSGHVRELNGWPVTTPARTCADCLRHLPAEDAVPIADAALRQGLMSVEQLTEVVRWQEAWPLGAAGLRASALVDARRESPLESRSAVVMYRHGLPAPLCQVDVRDAAGRFVARVDFAWPAEQVVGEADGRTKYEGDTVAKREAEKDRQAALEALGLTVVRWGSRHLAGRPPELVARLRQGLARGARAPFTGTLVTADTRGRR